MMTTTNARLTSTARWARQTLTTLFSNRLSLAAMAAWWACLSASVARDSEMRDAPVIVVAVAAVAVVAVLSSGATLIVSGLIGMVESYRTK